MTDELRQLEQTVEQQMSLLRDLPRARPSAERLASVKAAVAAEAGRLAVRRARWHSAAGMIGLAAAVALALVLTAQWPERGGAALHHGRGGVMADSSQLLDEWASAVEDSGEVAQAILTDEWVLNGLDRNRDREGDFETLFRAFDELESIGI